jgi:hypothetical protein
MPIQFSTTDKICTSRQTFQQDTFNTSEKCTFNVPEIGRIDDETEHFISRKTALCSEKQKILPKIRSTLTGHGSLYKTEKPNVT